MDGQPVTIRTLDLGPDKYPSYLRLPQEENPYLGWRSIRISLEMDELFKGFGRREGDLLAGFDFDRFTGLWVSASPGL